MFCIFKKNCLIWRLITSKQKIVEDFRRWHWVCNKKNFQKHYKSFTFKRITSLQHLLKSVAFFMTSVVLQFVLLKEVYLFTQKTEVEHLKFNFFERYPLLGGADLVKWIVFEKKLKPSEFGDCKNLQNLYANSYCDDCNIYTNGRGCMLIMFFFCFRLFLVPFWVMFWPFSTALDPLQAWGW